MERGPEGGIPEPLLGPSREGQPPAAENIGEVEPPHLADETRWYTEHTALLVSTLKWSLLGAATGFCVGEATRAFLWSLAATSRLTARDLAGRLHPYYLLPAALPACVWLIRTFAPSAKGHGTEAVIAAVHQRSGRIDWKVAPIKLLATVLTLAFGGSVGKEGPCAQIGAAITSLFADVLRLGDEDRRRLVICGIGAGFAAVFGTPISGALFGIEVLYLGRIEYPVFFPCLIAGIVAHLVCGVTAPVPVLHDDVSMLGKSSIVPMAVALGGAFGLIALLLIETMRTVERGLRRFEDHPYWVAAGGGVALALLYATAGDAYAGLGTDVIEASLAGVARLFVLGFFFKILATAVTLESGGSGGIVTPLFFIGATSGASVAQLMGLPTGVFAAWGFVSVLAAAANTPIAAAVMGMELLPKQLVGRSALRGWKVVGIQVCRELVGENTREPDKVALEGRGFPAPGVVMEAETIPVAGERLETGDRFLVGIDVEEAPVGPYRDVVVAAVATDCGGEIFSLIVEHRVAAGMRFSRFHVNSYALRASFSSAWRG